MSLVEAGSEPSALLIRTHRVRTLAPLSRNRHHSEPWAPRSFASTNLVGALTWVSVIGSASSSSRETRLRRSRCFGRSRKGLELRHRASRCGDCFFPPAYRTLRPAARCQGDQPGSFRACLAAPIIALSTAINSDRTVGGPIFLPSERWHRRRAAKVGWRMDGPKGPARPRRREAGGDRQAVRGASITETDRSMLSGLQRGGPR